MGSISSSIAEEPAAPVYQTKAISGAYAEKMLSSAIAGSLTEATVEGAWNATKRGSRSEDEVKDLMYDIVNKYPSLYLSAVTDAFANFNAAFGASAEQKLQSLRANEVKMARGNVDQMRKKHDEMRANKSLDKLVDRCMRHCSGSMDIRKFQQIFRAKIGPELAQAHGLQLNKLKSRADTTARRASQLLSK
jgi:hypothetical protein